MVNQLTFGPPLDELLDRLYAASDSQTGQTTAYFAERAADAVFDRRKFDARTHRFMSDKLVALDRDKAEFCYQLCRTINARRIVEAGTSFGVSTLFLAAAVRDNLRESGGSGVVIGTEHEPEKAAVARANFAAANLSVYIELRQGDLRETLKQVDGPIDFMLIDIWTAMALPALALVAPHLREGAVVVCDNTTQFRAGYREYFEFIADPVNGFSTMTLPFTGGLEFTIRRSK
jgi:predicted O-methyltransferase YrrM